MACAFLSDACCHCSLGALRTQMATVDKDYLKPSARGVCVTCRQNVTGDMLVRVPRDCALVAVSLTRSPQVCRTRAFHPDHFQCTGCKKRLNTDPFYYKDSLSQVGRRPLQSHTLCALMLTRAHSIASRAISTC